MYVHMILYIDAYVDAYVCVLVKRQALMGLKRQLNQVTQEYVNLWTLICVYAYGII